MRTLLEAEKRQAAQEKARADEYAKMIEESRKAYQILYAACEKVVQAQDDAMPQNCPAWFNQLTQEVFNAMAEAELASPFGIEGSAEPVADYCRTCGRPIDRTDAKEAYCEMCSRSSKVQTEEIPVASVAQPEEL